MANPKLTNAKPFNFHLEAGTADGVLTAGNQISDVTKTEYNADGSIKVLVTVQDTIDSFAGAVDGKQDKIDAEHKLSADLVDDTTATHKFVTTEDKTTWNAKYSKPTTGIPETDLTPQTQEKIARSANAATVTQLNEGLSEKQNTLIPGTGIVISTDNVISAPNTLTDLERLWVKTQVFNQYFTAVITPPTMDQNVLTFIGTKVVFALTTKFNNVLTDLDIIPTGWDKVDGTTGRYKKEVDANITGTMDRAGGESGDVECTVGTLTKVISGSVVSIYKPAYIWVTDIATPTGDQIAAAVAAEQVTTYANSDNLTGIVTVSGCTGKYVHFVTPVYNNPNITGATMKTETESISNFRIDSKNIGKYKYYSTATTQTTDEVVFTIS